MALCLGSLYLLCLCCQSPPPEATGPAGSAGRLWDIGQDSMRHGHPDLAIRLYERSLRADPNLTRNYVSLAAAYLQLGDDAAACSQLARYVAFHPDQLLMRVH